MLEGILYRVVSRADNAATVCLLPESCIYKAHFPDYPVTPGVTLVQMALELMGRKLTGARDIKFIVPVLPAADGPELRYSWSYKDDTTADVMLCLADGTLCAKMTLSVQ